MKEEIIEELTRLLIIQDLEDKENGKDTFVRKTRIYKDLIKFIREYL